jgi:hypothetical protein
MINVWVSTPHFLMKHHEQKYQFGDLLAASQQEPLSRRLRRPLKTEEIGEDTSRSGLGTTVPRHPC